MQQIAKSLADFNVTEIKNKTDPLYLSRQDYKFIVPYRHLDALLNYLKANFHLSVREGESVFKYQNIYFDTDDFRFFTMHRQGKYNRVKLRIRHYKKGVESSFLECKRKVKGGHTKKERKKLNIKDKLSQVLNDEMVLKTIRPYNIEPSHLTRITEITYHRIGFINKGGGTRVSMDFDISAKGAEENEVYLLSDHLILEIKSHRFPRDFMRFLRQEFRIRETPFSKYCISLCLLHDKIKKNKWKQVLKKYCRKEYVI